MPSSTGIWPLFWTLRELCPANILHTLFVENPIIKGVCWVCRRNPFNTEVYMPPRLRALCVRSLSDGLSGFISDCGQPQSASTGSPPGSHSLNLIEKCVFFSFCPFSLWLQVDRKLLVMLCPHGSVILKQWKRCFLFFFFWRSTSCQHFQLK